MPQKQIKNTYDGTRTRTHSHVTTSSKYVWCWCYIFKHLCLHSGCKDGKKSSAKQNHMSNTQYCWIKYGAHTLSSSVLNQRPLYLPVILLFCLTNRHINRHTHSPQPSVSLTLFSRALQNNKTSKNTNNCRRNHCEHCSTCPTRNHWPPWLCNVCDCLVACHAVSHFLLVWMCNSIAY